MTFLIKVSVLYPNFRLRGKIVAFSAVPRAKTRFEQELLGDP